MNTDHSSSGPHPPSETDRRFPRRFLLAASGAAAAVGVTQAIPSSAEAATGTTAWKLGGNTGVTTDGSNFLGPTNAGASLIFKTKATAADPLSEKVRIGPKGSVGINVANPVAKLDVLGLTTTPVAIKGVNPNTASTAMGVTGSSVAGTGVAGTSTNGSGTSGSSSYIGVSGQGGSYGGVFTSSAAGSIGAYCTASNYGGFFSGNTYGLYASGGEGVHGIGSTNGVYGSASSNGVYGTGSTGVSGHGGSIGVFGGDASNSGVRGDSTYVGVWGTGNTWGMYAQSKGTTGQIYGVFGATDSPSGFGVYSDGNCHVQGTLSKTAGAFKIDHPLDPENKWLSHSFVESPDMMNVYNGNVILDAQGRATVRLPSYFSALNREFRYQLTPIGAPARDLHIAREIAGGAFRIAGGAPRAKVSWQVTGIRKDNYAREHPIVVETQKSKQERGMLAFVPRGSSAQRLRHGPRPTALPETIVAKEAKIPAPRH